MRKFKPLRIDDRCRVVIPNHVLETLDLKSGDYVTFEKINGTYCFHKVCLIIKRNGGMQKKTTTCGDGGEGEVIANKKQKKKHKLQ